MTLEPNGNPPPRQTTDMRAPTPCPSSPNCVTSVGGADPDHFVAPLRYQDAREHAKARLQTILRALPRTTIVEDEGVYLHAECTSLVFRFVDDLEFWFDERDSIVHVRSASRVGYSDLGVNRRRIETIRSRFQRQD